MPWDCAARGHGLAAIVAAAIVLAAAPPAARAQATGGGDERVAYIVRQLERAPLYVSDTLNRVIPPAQVQRIRAELSRAPVPTFVAILPQGAFADPVRYAELAGLLRARLRRPGLYITLDETGIYLTALSLQTPMRLDETDLSNAMLDDIPQSLGPAERIVYVLELLRTGRRSPRDDPEASPSLAVELAGTGAAGLLVFAALTVPYERRRRAKASASRSRRRLRAPDPRVLPPPAADHGPAAHEALALLSSELGRAPQPPDAAFEAYAAASKALADGGAQINAVGALVLARRGLALLRGDEPAPCFFDPLHGERREPTRWRLRETDVVIPACQRCARRLRDGEEPESLADGDVPYWQRDTIWARTGFGAVDDELAARVLAGEARR